MPATKELVHDPKAFKVGSQVRVTMRVESAKGWADSWGGREMDSTVGKVGVVRSVTDMGFEVGFAGLQDAWFYPSCALEYSLTEKTPEEKLVEKLDDKAAAKKVKRTRVVKPGPWDSAPCTHLRFMLMGFFRDKLALANSSDPAGVAAVDVVCSKCNQRMTMRTK